MYLLGTKLTVVKDSICRDGYKCHNVEVTLIGKGFVEAFSWLNQFTSYKCIGGDI